MSKEMIWVNGKYVEKGQGMINISTAALHYGTSVFEGILCMGTRPGNQSAIFRLPEHLDRMFKSAQVLNYRIPFSRDELQSAICGLIKLGQSSSSYIRPIIFEKTGYLDFAPKKNDLNIAILGKDFNSTLYRWKMRRPVKVSIAKNVTNSWPEILIKAKLSGKYLYSILARKLAGQNGFEDAIILDSRGYVSEATSANIFMVQGGVITTPHRKYTLNGVTQDSVIRIARDLGYPVAERDIQPQELLEAEEVFLTNTASGIISVAQIDAKQLPLRPPAGLVKHLRQKYIEIITGQDKKYQEWLNLI